MKIKIGDYTFSLNPDYDFSKTKEERGWKYQINFTGVLVAAGANAVKSARDALIAGVLDNKDVKITNDAGNIVYDQLLNSSSIGGIKVKLIQYPTALQANWVTMRNYKIQIESYEKILSSDTSEFQESISVREGKITRVALEDIDGDLPIIISTSRTPTEITQSGSATGLTAYPSFPDYKYNEINLMPPISKEKESPKRNEAGNLIGYKIKWSYTYIFSSMPTFENPNNPPA